MRSAAFLLLMGALIAAPGMTFCDEGGLAPVRHGDAAWFRGDLQRTGSFRAAPMTVKPSVKWAFKAEGSFLSPPVAAGDTLFLGDEEYIYAIDRNRGTLRWKYHLSGAGAPAIVDNTVYFGASTNALYAMDARSGDIRWKILTGTDRPSSPALAQGTLFFGGGSFRSTREDHGYLAAVDAATGDERWIFRTRNRVMTPPAIADGIVYFGYGDAGHLLSGGGFYAVRAIDGGKLWEVPNILSVRGAPAIFHDSIYVSIGSGIRGALLALSRQTGQVLWKVASQGAANTPAVADGTVYFGTSDDQAGTFYAVDALTGGVRWQHHGDAWFEQAPAVAGRIVYAADHRGVLHAFAAADGKELWRFQPQQRNSPGAPLPVGKTIYFSSGSTLYALE